MLNSRLKKTILFFLIYYISNLCLWYFFDRSNNIKATNNAGLEYFETNLFNPLTNFGYSLSFNYYWVKSGIISIVIILLFNKKIGEKY